MRRQRILTGEDDVQAMLSWFGATGGRNVTQEMLEERLRESTPMISPRHEISLLICDADEDGDGQLSATDIGLLLKNPNKWSRMRVFAVKLW
jgi:hypothetical protein